MPTIELVRDTAPTLLPMMGRSKGDHVSTLIFELCVELGYIKLDDEEEVNQARFELGNAWEFAIINRFQLEHPNDYLQTEELQLGSIFGTPDLVNMPKRAVNEFKASWMSAKNGPGSDKFWKFERQIMAYCHMLGWRLAYLHVAFVNGEYEFYRWGAPKWRTWRYKFTTQELEMNWKMLMNQAKRGASKRTRS